MTSFTFILLQHLQWLGREQCGFIFLEQRNLISQTIVQILESMCSTETLSIFISNINPTNPPPSERLIPLEFVIEFEDATISTDLSLGKFCLN